MKKTIIIREGKFDPFKFNDEKIYLHTIKPEFFKWNGQKFENVFVGVCSLKIGNCDAILYSLPKYFPEEKCEEIYLDEIKKVLKTICRVAEKIKKDKKKSKILIETDNFFEPYNSQNKKDNVNRMELAEYIIEDYIQNGLFIKDVTQTKKNGIGRTSWAKTVAKITPIVQDDSVIYLDCMNNEHFIDENDFISVIHANIVNQCLELIGPLLSGGIMSIEDKEILEKDLSEYANVINVQSSYVFRERDINLFKALEAWCKQTKYYDNYIGVTRFDRVWEWVNDAVWGNINEIESDKPRYFFDFDNGYGYKGTGNAIPDTVRVEPKYHAETAEKIVYIFDSKYYVIRNLEKRSDNKEEIIGWPANADIAKQIEYLELLKYLINQVMEENKNDSNIGYRNAFLLPECFESLSESVKQDFVLDNDKWYKKIGYVEQGSFNALIKTITGLEPEKGINGRKVDIIIVKPEVLYAYYLNNKKVTPEELYAIWDEEEIET